jgi:hypothetical protein
MKKQTGWIKVLRVIEKIKKCLPTMCILSDVNRQTGCYWPTMLEDCFEYYKGCQDCQKFGNIQRVPTSALNPIIKSWPFRGWGIDLIGQINPPSSKGHKFVLLATNYFTKWVEAIPLKKVTSENMVEFVKEHIIY